MTYVDPKEILQKVRAENAAKEATERAANGDGREEPPLASGPEDYGANGRGTNQQRAKSDGDQDCLPPLPFIDMSTWDEVPAPPRHWLGHDRSPRRQPTILSGHGEAGKSTLLLQLLCATVLGRDWIGLLPEPGPAIYFGAEEEEDELHRRFEPILSTMARASPT